MRYARILISYALFLSLNVSAEGLDEVYIKDSSEKPWAQRFAEKVGYDSGFSKSYALVVGISKFDHYADLPTAEDPVRVSDFLIGSGFDEVHILTEEKVTLDRLRTLMLDAFPSKVDGNDRFLLYWSGHGVERNNSFGGQTGHLPLADSRKGVFSTMASMDDISRWDGFLQARHALYLVDACFSGLAGVVAKSGHAELVVDQMLRPARFLLTAGSAEEETIASDKWGGSLFTHALLSGLEGAADTSSKDFTSDGVITLFELIGHIKKRVAVERDNRWPKPITPQLRDLRGSDGEFFFLVRNSTDTVPSKKRENSPPVVPMSAGLGVENLREEGEDASALRSSCEHGNLVDCRHIGLRFRDGQNVEVDFDKANNFFSLACDGGDMVGCRLLGISYRLGYGFDENQAKAIGLLRQACNGGDMHGCNHLGAMLDSRYRNRADIESANALFRQACNGDDMIACVNLAGNYESGRGVEVDYAEANALYKKACDGRETVGCTDLAENYEQGLGVEVNMEEASRLYRQACDFGDVGTCASLALDYTNGEGLEVDLKKANDLFKKACEWGDSFSCEQL